MDFGLVVTFTGIAVAGLAGVLGVWMERDQEAPTRWAWVFSFFVIVSMGIEMAHSTVQAAEDGVTEEALARVLERLTEISEKSDNPALQSFVSSELAAQARSNPEVVKKVEKKVAAKGGDPKAIRKKAVAGRRTSAGLPAKKGGKMGQAGKGGKAGKAGKGGKAGKSGKSGKAGKAGKASDADAKSKGGEKGGKGGKGGGSNAKGGGGDKGSSGGSKGGKGGGSSGDKKKEEKGGKGSKSGK